jgi:hypothetical protein
MNVWQQRTHEVVMKWDDPAIEVEHRKWALSLAHERNRRMVLNGLEPDLEPDEATLSRAKAYLEFLFPEER